MDRGCLHRNTRAIWLLILLGRHPFLVGEDRTLQFAQLRTRLEAEFIDHPGAESAVHLERLRLAAAATQRTHQLRMRPLLERSGSHERLEFGDHFSVSAQREVTIDPVSDGKVVEFAQAPELSVDERVVLQTFHRQPAPLGQCLGQQTSPRRRLRDAVRLRDVQPKTPDVGLLVADAKPVAARLGHERARAVVVERATQLGD